MPPVKSWTSCDDASQTPPNLCLPSTLFFHCASSSYTACTYTQYSPKSLFPSLFTSFRAAACPLSFPHRSFQFLPLVENIRTPFPYSSHLCRAFPLASPRYYLHANKLWHLNPSRLEAWFNHSIWLLQRPTLSFTTAPVTRFIPPISNYAALTVSCWPRYSFDP
jgi:hypothetical protein